MLLVASCCDGGDCGRGNGEDNELHVVRNVLTAEAVTGVWQRKDLGAISESGESDENQCSRPSRGVLPPGVKGPISIWTPHTPPIVLHYGKEPGSYKYKRLK